MYMGMMTPFPCTAMPILNIIIILIIMLHPGSSASASDDNDLFIVNVTMKDYQSTKEDQIVFIQYKLADEELTIVGYTPLVTTPTAHHMNTVACENPNSQEPFWTDGQACGAGAQMLLYGWDRNALPFRLPEGVGIVVGKNTPYKYIVVNIHYLPIVKNDYSGNQLIISRKRPKYLAGVMSGGADSINLPPQTHTIKIPFSCQYNGPNISIFAAGVHAHRWARVNSLYRVRDGKITLILKGDPQQTHQSYLLPSSIEIIDGDYIVGQCVYDNDEDRAITFGLTHNDEMCNVLAGYLYEPNNDKQINARVPFETCWGNRNPHLSDLIPPDSEVPPKKSSDTNRTDQGQHDDAEHTMIISTDHIYVHVEDWPDLKSLPKSLGEISGIALNRDNTELVVFHRGSRKWQSKYFTNKYRFLHELYGPIEDDVLIHIDTRTGQTKSCWGAKIFYLPHGLTIDHEGNYWVTDVALHQVFMFQPHDLTHPALTVGTIFDYGSGSKHFCQPTDVAVMKNGDFFVADGYCNNRIVKFNRQGEYITEWSLDMSSKLDVDDSLLANQWNIVHSIALNEDAQLICSNNPNNGRIQCLNLMTGEFQRQIRVKSKGEMSLICAIEFSPNANGTILFALNGGTQSATKKVYIIDAQTGDILTFFDSNLNFISPDDIAVSINAREIYVADLVASSANALHKFELTTRKDLPTHTYRNRIDFNDKRFYISLIIVVVFGIAFLLAVIVGRLIRMHTLGGLGCLNTLLKKEIRAGPSRRSILSGWLNRSDGFERLEQSSDGENEVANDEV